MSLPPWNTVWTAASLNAYLAGGGSWYELAGMYAYALRERLRLVLRDTHANDLWLHSPVNGRATTLWAASLRVLGLDMGWPDQLSNLPLVTDAYSDKSLYYDHMRDTAPYTLAAANTNGEGKKYYQPPAGIFPGTSGQTDCNFATYDGNPLDPGGFKHVVWRDFHSTFPDPAVGKPYVPFTFPLAQRLVTFLAYYFVDPALEPNGYTYAAWAAASKPFVTKHYPNKNDSGGFFENMAVNRLCIDGGYTATFGRLPVMAGSLPDWPNGGFNRKREREITSLSAGGTNGQKARFVYAEPRPGATWTGIGYPGFNDKAYDYKTASAYPANAWLLDPKPLVQDVQAPSLPASTEAERAYSGKVMLRQGGAWVEHPDQSQHPDGVTLKGWARPGDLVVAQFLNELRDAINLIWRTAWPGLKSNRPATGGGTEYAYVLTDAFGGYNAAESEARIGHRRGVGCNMPPFGPRKIDVYRYNDNSTPLQFEGSIAATAVKNPHLPIAGGASKPDTAWMVVDWRPALAFRADTNPTSLPAWPASPTSGPTSAWSS